MGSVVQSNAMPKPHPAGSNIGDDMDIYRRGDYAFDMARLVGLKLTVRDHFGSGVEFILAGGGGFEIPFVKGEHARDLYDEILVQWELTPQGPI